MRVCSCLSAQVGNFLGPDQHNLLVAKVTQIEIFEINADGVVGVISLPIYGMCKLPNPLPSACISASF